MMIAARVQQAGCATACFVCCSRARWCSSRRPRTNKSIGGLTHSWLLAHIMMAVVMLAR
eukprot:SAG25_NODE_1014_length_4295_cov_2.060043_4_plen_59_part_00